MKLVLYNDDGKDIFTTNVNVSKTFGFDLSESEGRQFLMHLIIEHVTVSSMKLVLYNNAGEDIFAAEVSMTMPRTVGYNLSMSMGRRLFMTRIIGEVCYDEGVEVQKEWIPE